MSLERTIVAAWSGPRNISTAMMRSWENRTDTAVIDEPLYGHYLLEHGLDHPGREEILERCETDAAAVIEHITGPVPGGRAVWYQKHMAHHLLDDVPREWLDLDEVRHVFLIREPEEMLTSLIQVTPDPTLADTGLPQQLEIFERRRRREHATPPVIEARDVLDRPRQMLEALCAAVGLPFEERMLSWPSGPRDTDGLWAPHWYASVQASTGFQPYRPKGLEVPQRLRGLLVEAEAIYEELRAHRLH